MISSHYERERNALLDAASHAPDAPVATCPGWTVTDVVRHLTGLCDDWLTGRVEVYASPAWTAAQVDRFAAEDLAGVRVEWDRRAEQFGQILDDPASADHLPEEITTVVGRLPTTTFPGGIVVDLGQHSADVTSAVDRDTVLAPETVIACNRGMAGSLRMVWKTFDLPTLILRTSDTGEEYHLGIGDPVASVQATSFDLFRTFGGRRSLDQTRSLAWNGDPELAQTLAARLTVPFFSPPGARVEAAHE